MDLNAQYGADGADTDYEQYYGNKVAAPTAKVTTPHNKAWADEQFAAAQDKGVNLNFLGLGLNTSYKSIDDNGYNLVRQSGSLQLPDWATGLKVGGSSDESGGGSFNAGANIEGVTVGGNATWNHGGLTGGGGSLNALGGNVSVQNTDGQTTAGAGFKGVTASAQNQGNQTLLGVSARGMDAGVRVTSSAYGQTQYDASARGHGVSVGNPQSFGFGPTTDSARTGTGTAVIG